MKDWEYYSQPKGVEYFDTSDKRRELTEKIDNTPMTAAERVEAIEAVRGEAKRICRELNEPYLAAVNKLEREFWTDAADELGYVGKLPESAIESLHAMAWSEGHAHGFSEVFSRLCELSEFALRVADAVREEMKAGAKQ